MSKEKEQIITTHKEIIITRVSSEDFDKNKISLKNSPPLKAEPNSGAVPLFNPNIIRPAKTSISIKIAKERENSEGLNCLHNLEEYVKDIESICSINSTDSFDESNTTNVTVIGSF